MALKAKELNLTFDLDEFTWDDYINIRSNDPEKYRSVFNRLCRIEGKTASEVAEILGQLSFYDIQSIDTLLAKAMNERSNPTDEATGKN